MKKIEYFSTDKVYRLKKNITNNLLLVSFIVAIMLIIATVICFKQSIVLRPTDNLINYNEKGEVDYKIYLKENDYYDTSYLDKGMQYVASLINTINVKFNYQVNTGKTIDYDSAYYVEAELQITEKDSPSKILYSKKERLSDLKTIQKKGDELIVNEEIDIDYNKYNNIVNSYKGEYGLIASSNLILTLKVDTKGTVENNESIISRARDLKIIIPLSEQTVDIKLDIDEINEKATVIGTQKAFKIKNIMLFIVLILVASLTIASVAATIYLYIKQNKKDAYKNKVGKILKDYDRLIVNGKVTIDENKFSNKIYPVSFEEMVDAATQLEVPIYFYEVIPNEKCFFIIVKDKTLYKYRLTKAFLEKNPTNKVEKPNSGA